MKRFVVLILIPLLLFCSCAHNSRPSESGATELVVFAAASMTETMNRIKTMYENANQDITVVCNFDSSGTLKTQIEEGAYCDVFISASPKQMNQLDISKGSEANPDRLDFVLQGTRSDLLENRVVLCSASNSALEIGSFDELSEALIRDKILLCIGNSDVPVGQYSRKILQYYGIDEERMAAAGKITYGSNVKEITTAIAEGTVDCGIIYSTDAYSAGLTPADTATEEMCGRAIYPAAVMNVTTHEEAARDFLEFLKGNEATAVFESVGFSIITG